MTKEELRELAAAGIRYRLVEVERHLANWFAEFPEYFSTPTAPTFVRLESRNGKSEWPVVKVRKHQQPLSKDPKTVWRRVYDHLQQHGPTREIDLKRMLKKPRNYNVRSCVQSQIKRGILTVTGGVYAVGQTAPE